MAAFQKFKLEEEAKLLQKLNKQKSFEIPTIKSYVKKEGNFTKLQREKLLGIIERANDVYPDSAAQQLEVIHFHAASMLGKRIQIVIYPKNTFEGHCLYAVNAKYMEVLLGNLNYIVWKVVLIEDDKQTIERERRKQ